jgi:hypothetical protein
MVLQDWLGTKTAAVRAIAEARTAGKTGHSGYFTAELHARIGAYAQTVVGTRLPGGAVRTRCRTNS